jgi:hypothetical protein
MESSKMTKHGQSCSLEEINNEIRKKAAEIYEQNGRLPGRDMENWLEAERIVKSTYKCGKPKTTVPRNRCCS